MKPRSEGTPHIPAIWPAASTPAMKAADPAPRTQPYSNAPGALRSVEQVYRTKDGHCIPVLFSGSIIYDDVGRVQGIVCIAQDITERKQTEAGIRLAMILNDAAK